MTASTGPSFADGPGAGQVLGPYQLLHEIGRGGHSRVFAATQPGLQRRIAVKVLGPQTNTGGDGALLRFQREARLLASLAHPGIVRVLDAGTHTGLPYIAMELVPGCSLAVVLERLRGQGGVVTTANLRAAVQAGAASSGTAAAPGAAEPAGERWQLRSTGAATMLALLAEVAEALASAHAAGVVHRDVKPSNVLVHCDGRALLADFGIAQRQGSDTAITRAGTPAYMAPEQARGSPGDHRSDQFSLAATLFEALTLQVPFPAGSPAELALRLQQDEVPDPRRFAPQLGADTAAVLQKALSRDPARRYASVGDFAADLRAILAGEPTQARPPGRIRRTVGWLRKKPWRSTTVALATGAAIALLAVDQQQRTVLAGERERADAALARRHRLSLGVRLDRVLALAVDWRGIDPTEGPRIEAWLRDEAAPLAAELPRLDQQLAELRAQALPPSAADVAADRARVGYDEPIHQADREIAFREAAIENRDGNLADHRKRLQALRTTRAELDARLAANRSWRLSTDEEQFLHDQIAALVTRLTAFCRGPQSRSEWLRSRVAATATFQRRSIVDAADRWREAARAVADDPRFAALQLPPRCDLLPLRADPASGLWEFVHLPSGSPDREVPTVGADGRYELTDDTGIVVVLLPGGSFTMGAQKEDRAGPNYDPEALATESPLREVALDPFYCGKFEMTEAQLLRLAGPGGEGRVRDTQVESVGQKTTAKLPAVSISQRRLKAVIEPLGLLLPTEAQWEYACRAGTATPFHFGTRDGAGKFANVSDESAKRAGARWTLEAGVDDGHPGIAPIGSLAANAFGLHDMHGNVAEMVDDPAGRHHFPARPGDGRSQAMWGQEWIVFRGGTYAHNLFSARSGGRALHESRDFKTQNVGARIVLPLQP
ncbi:MAG: bifunctional serine/threonine-protein kinase/formylglycine-generating enzyme family protein [Planctomycetes bacterium]|jgi:serine/threonine protein kinase/formylglycine-generating enzyme required for sulfatase activity|nr:bifunctional serine/threonine-protein kinase/formylglycine-generating enzyme family protein [Planctomycetota bacterium]